MLSLTAGESGRSERVHERVSGAAPIGYSSVPDRLELEALHVAAVGSTLLASWCKVAANRMRNRGPNLDHVSDRRDRPAAWVRPVRSCGSCSRTA